MKINKDSYFYIYEDHLGGGYYVWELEQMVHQDIAMLRAAREAMGIGKKGRA